MGYAGEVSGAAEEPWKVGDLVAGRYVLTGPPIGSGASGVVYPADDAEGRPVAVKRLHRELGSDSLRFERLRRELRRASRLRHPHILRVRGLVAHGRASALVTDRVDGGSVEQLGQPLGPDGAIAVGIGVAQALAAAHREGIVHGDVRPGNVLVGSAGASLFDFGITEVARLGELRPGETPPEVLDGSPPTERSDLYGVGLVVYRAVMGQAAFSGPTAWARIGRQRDGQLDVEGLEPGLASCLARLLHPDPLQRPSSAVTVIAMLRVVQRRPQRPARVPRARLAPMRLRRRWCVHGTDPTTGAQALLRTDLTHREARRLVRRLRGEGWQVQRARTALGPGDLLFTLMMGALGFVVLPVVGFPLFAWASLRWRSSRTNHELPRALPRVMAPLPPRRVPAGGEVALTAGLLLLLTAGLLVVWPMASLFSMLALVALVSHALGREVQTPSQLARQARIDNGLVLARRELRDGERGGRPIDEVLGLLGSLDALEAAWRAGEVSDDDTLRRLEALTPADRKTASSTSPAVHPAPGPPSG